MHRWLNRLDRLTQTHLEAVPRQVEGKGITKATNKAIKEVVLCEAGPSKDTVPQHTPSPSQVTEMMEQRHSFNLAVSALMKLSNVLQDKKNMAGTAKYHMALSTLTVLLAPMAPHMASQLWSGESCSLSIVDACIDLLSSVSVLYCRAG